jgi:hypothetical protein
MIDKLRLPFPMLTDEDRSAVIGPWDLANPTDKRNLALPAVSIVTPEGDEAFRWVSQEFAFRIPEDEVVAVLSGLGLPATTQDPPELGTLEPGRFAMPIRAMEPYFRGARFAAVALGTRNPNIQGDVEFFTDQMDRYRHAVRDLKARLRAGEEAADER